MPARKNRTGPLDGHWKNKIRTGVIVSRLQDHHLGKLDLTSSQIEAAKILLRKTAPDLANVAIGQDENKGPLQISWGGKP